MGICLESIITGGRKFWTLADKAQRQAVTVIRQGLCQFNDAKQINMGIPKEIYARQPLSVGRERELIRGLEL